MTIYPTTALNGRRSGIPGRRFPFPEIAVDKFDYQAPAELFPSRNRKIPTKVKYRRFERAADAIRFAIEELPAPLLLGAFIEVEEGRLGHKDIRELYDSADYPLTRTLN
jgi:hypothetical protein